LTWRWNPQRLAVFRQVGCGGAGAGGALWIPPGFAHGFQALEETHFLYLVTKEYDPQRDRCIKWDDPAIAVRWPSPDRAILSQRDRGCPPLAEAENNFEY
jgi:dTDP-4-dehydrorhamnose 3,5-epimerase